MFCSKCGAQIEDGSKFCPKCGENIKTGNQDVSTNVDNNKKPKKKKFIILAIIAIAIIAIASSLLSGGGKLDFKDYINETIPFEGVSGYATVDENDVIDYKKLLNDMGKSSYAKNNFNDTNSLIEMGVNELLSTGSNIAVKNSINVELDKKSELANGDIITATITVDYNSISELKYDKKLKGKDTYTVKYEVSGLEEAIVVNPFEVIESVVCDMTEYNNCDISYNQKYLKDIGNGYSVRYTNAGSLALEIVDSSKERVGTISFSADGDSVSSSGKVTLTVDEPIHKYEEAGIVVSPKIQEIEPIIIDYVEKNNLTSEVVDEIKNYVSREAIESKHHYYNNIKLEKTYFNEADDKSRNELIFVFSGVNKSNAKKKVFGYTMNEIKIDSNNKLYLDDTIYYCSVRDQESVNDFVKELLIKYPNAVEMK